MSFCVMVAGCWGALPCSLASSAREMEYGSR
jgi:hypothetical protein